MWKLLLSCAVGLGLLVAFVAVAIAELEELSREALGDRQP